MKHVLVLLVVMASVALGAETRLNVLYTRLTLPNGLTVILHEDHTTPTVVEGGR